MKVSNTKIGVATAFIVLLGYGLCILTLGYLDSADAMSRTTLIPPDSLNYASIGEEGSSRDLSIAEVALGSLNWSTLPFVFGFFQTRYSAGGIFFLLLNTFATVWAISGSISLLTGRGYFIRHQWLSLLLPLVILMCMPYVWGWVLAPNKELLVGAAVIGIMQLLEKRRLVFAIALAVLAAMTKVQILYAMALYLCTVAMPYRKTLCFVGLSLVLPIALQLNPDLTTEQLVETVSDVDVVRTAWFFEALDKICAQPLGFLVVAPIRFFVNCISGLYPLRLLGSASIGAALGPATSLLLGLLCVLFLVLRSRVLLAGLSGRGSHAWHFFYCYILVSCIVPFLQPRYYWWLIPVLVTALATLPQYASGRKEAPELSSAELLA